MLVSNATEAREVAKKEARRTGRTQIVYQQVDLSWHTISKAAYDAVPRSRLSYEEVPYEPVADDGFDL